MTKEAKALKIACLAALFAGVFVLAATIYLIVTEGFSQGNALCLGAGLAELVCGAQGARLANVPSNAKAIRTLMLVLALALIVVAAVGYALRLASTLQVALSAGSAVVALIATIMAHRQVKALEQV